MAAAARPDTGRRHDVDRLRNLALLYLFPFHTARVFDASEPYYVEGEPQVLTTLLVQLSHWFMPLLFLLAGVAAFHSLQRRSTGAFLRERVQRLLVPLVAGLVLLVPPQAYVGRLAHDGDAPGYLAFLREYATDWSDLSGYHGSFTPGQLWFIAYLVVISVVLVPLVRRLRHHDATVPPAVVLLVPPVGLALLGALPAVGGLNPFVFAGFYGLGAWLGSGRGLVEGVAARRRGLLALAVVGSAGMLLERATVGWQSGPTLAGATASVLHLLVTWATVLAMLGYARVHLDRPSRATAYLNRAGFPLYVVHQTFVVGFGLLVVRAGGPVALQYVLVLVLSLLGSLATYEGARRVRPLAVLVGIKRPARAAAPAGPSRVVAPV